MGFGKHWRLSKSSYYANPPPQYTLKISTGAGGTTTPAPGGYQYTPQPVTVTANPYGGYVFDYWLLDGVPHPENPITVPMSSDHNLQANFRPPNYYWLTVDAVDGYVGYPLYPNIYIGGDWAGTGYASVQVLEGWHSVWVTTQYGTTTSVHTHISRISLTGMATEHIDQFMETRASQQYTTYGKERISKAESFSLLFSPELV